MSSGHGTCVATECAWPTLPCAISHAQYLDKARTNIVQQAHLVISCIIGTIIHRTTTPKTPTIPIGDCDTGVCASRQFFTPLSRARSGDATR